MRTSLLRPALALLAFAGLLIPWTFNIAWLAGGGSLAPGPFLAAVSANHLTRAITWDVYLSAVAFSLWVMHECGAGRRARGWGFVILCFGVGLSVALPAYLWARQASRPPQA